MLEENHIKVKSPDFQTEGVVRMEENIVGFDVEVADPSLVQILQGFSKLGTKCTNCINNEMHQSFIKLHSIEKGTFGKQVNQVQEKYLCNDDPTLGFCQLIMHRR